MCREHKVGVSDISLPSFFLIIDKYSLLPCVFRPMSFTFAPGGWGSAATTQCTVYYCYRVRTEYCWFTDFGVFGLLVSALLHKLEERRVGAKHQFSEIPTTQVCWRRWYANILGKYGRNTYIIKRRSHLTAKYMLLIN